MDDEGLGLPLDRLLEIPANNPSQPCSSFGIHENLSTLKDLFDKGKLNFIANAGLLAKPVTVDNYKGETPVQLFAHDVMTRQAKKEDITDKFAGTGMLTCTVVSHFPSEDGSDRFYYLYLFSQESVEELQMCSLKLAYLLIYSQSMDNK